jgi:hypothetical protein
MRVNPLTFKINAFILFTFLICGCDSIVLSTPSPTPDFEKTVYWLVDEAVSKASTQIMFDVDQKFATMEAKQPSPIENTIETATPAVSVVTAPFRGTSVPEALRKKENSVIENTPPSCIDSLKFVEDITIPDKTVVKAGKPFTKTWKIQNTGTCTWTEAYSVVFSDGDKMSALDRTGLPVGTSVKPNDTIEVSVYMIALNKADPMPDIGYLKAFRNPFWSRFKPG